MAKKLPANAGDVGPIPGSGRYPGVGDGNLLQYSFFFFVFNKYFGCAGSSLLLKPFSSCSEWGLLFVAEQRLQPVWASVAVAHGISSYGFQVLEHRRNRCGTWA